MYRVRCITGGAHLAPPICYRIAEKPPPNLSNSTSDNLCRVIIQQSILLANPHLIYVGHINFQGLPYWSTQFTLLDDSIVLQEGQTHIQLLYNQV